MSLFLVQGYDSDNDERILKERADLGDADTSDDDDVEGEGDDQSDGDGGAQDDARRQALAGPAARPTPVVMEKKGKTGLPSAAFAFSEVSEVPDFLRPAALGADPGITGVVASVAGIAGAHSHQGAKQHAIASAALSRDIAASQRAENAERQANGAPQGSSAEAGRREEGRGKVGAAMPPKEDAAMLLRVCEQCQVPKTFSNAFRGMVCPLCKGRPLSKGGEGGKKKEGGVKDKEKNKRMKGQSSHATWKSETEMQLRQTYD